MTLSAVLGHERRRPPVAHGGRQRAAGARLSAHGTGRRRQGDAGPRLPASLLCAAPHDGDACGACAQCTRVAAGTHPDVRLVAREEERRDIRTEQAREVTRWLTLRAADGGAEGRRRRRRRVPERARAERAPEDARGAARRVGAAPLRHRCVAAPADRPLALPAGAARPASRRRSSIGCWRPAASRPTCGRASCPGPKARRAAPSRWPTTRRPRRASACSSSSAACAARLPRTCRPSPRRSDGRIRDAALDDRGLVVPGRPGRRPRGPRRGGPQRRRRRRPPRRRGRQADVPQILGALETVCDTIRAIEGNANRVLALETMLLALRRAERATTGPLTHAERRDLRREPSRSSSASGFRPGGYVYDFDPGPLILHRDDRVLVETEHGPTLGTVVVPPARRPTDARISGASSRRPTPASWRARTRTCSASASCARRRSASCGRAACRPSWSRSRPRSTAHARPSSSRPTSKLDLRDLARDLGQALRTRIEMKQIGARDESKRRRRRRRVRPRALLLVVAAGVPGRCRSRW